MAPVASLTGEVGTENFRIVVHAPRMDNYPEFLPRFETAYRNAHSRFQAAVANNEPFVVTQNHVLDAQVFVEAAHRSAQAGGRHYVISRRNDLAAYRTACVTSGLMAA